MDDRPGSALSNFGGLVRSVGVAPLQEYIFLWINVKWKQVKEMCAAQQRLQCEREDWEQACLSQIWIVVSRIELSRATLVLREAMEPFSNRILPNGISIPSPSSKQMLWGTNFSLEMNKFMILRGILMEIIVDIAKIWWKLVASVLVDIHWRTAPTHLERGFTPIPPPYGKITFEHGSMNYTRCFPKC